MSLPVAYYPSRNDIHRHLKRVGQGVMAVVLVTLAGLLAVLFFLTHMSAGTAENLINRYLLASTQRTLKMVRDPHLDVWPMLKVQLGPCTLSEQKGTTPFARMESLELSMPWAPLLEKQAVISSLRMDGLFVTLIRDASGKLNIADLLEPDTDEKTDWSFRVDHLTLTQGQIRWRDHAQPPKTSLRAMDVDHLELSVVAGNENDVGDAGRTGLMNGKISLSAHGSSPTTPALDVKLTLASAYTVDQPRQTYSVQNTQVEMDGQYEKVAGRITLNIHETTLMPQAAAFHQLALSVQDATQSQAGSLFVPRLDVSSRALQADALQLNLASTFENGVQIKTRIATPLKAAFENQRLAVDLSAMETQLDMNAPKYLIRPLSLAGQGSIQAEMTRDAKNVPEAKNAQNAQNAEGVSDEQDAVMNMTARFLGQVDRSPFSLHVSLARASQLRIETALDMQRLDLDTWLKPAATATATSASKTAQASRPGAPGLLPPGLDFEGRFHAEALTFSGVQMHQLHLVATSRNGLLKIQSRQADVQLR